MFPTLFSFTDAWNGSGRMPHIFISAEFSNIRQGTTLTACFFILVSFLLGALLAVLPAG